MSPTIRRLVPLTLAIFLAFPVQPASALLGGLLSAQVRLPIVLNLKPGAVNTITIQIPGGPAFVSQISGFVQAETIVDTKKLLSPQGIVAFVEVKDLVIAGTSFPILGGLESGTVCGLPNPAGSSGGVAYLRPVIAQRADFHLNLDLLVSVLNPALASLGRLPFIAPVDASTQFDTFDALALLLGQPAIEITQHIETTLDPTIPLLGGAKVAVDATFVNGNTPIRTALTDECQAAY
jgi:hypothetical protein